MFRTFLNLFRPAVVAQPDKPNPEIEKLDAEIRGLRTGLRQSDDIKRAMLLARCKPRVNRVKDLLPQKDNLRVDWEPKVYVCP